MVEPSNENRPVSSRTLSAVNPIGLIGAAHDNADHVRRDQQRLLDVAWSEDCDLEKRLAWDAWQAVRSDGKTEWSLLAEYPYKQLKAELHARYNEVRLAVAPYEVMYRCFPHESRALFRSIDVLQHATCGLSDSDFSDSKLTVAELDQLAEVARPSLQDLKVRRDRKCFKELRSIPRINAVAPYVMAVVMASRDLADGARHLAVSGYVYEHHLRNFYDLAVSILSQSGDWKQDRFRAFDFTLRDL